MKQKRYLTSKNKQSNWLWMICQCKQQPYNPRGEDNTRLGHCTSCTFNSLPSNNLNDNDFYDIVTLRYHLPDNLLTYLQNSKLNPFSLNRDNNIRAENYIDPDNNYVLRQINEDNDTLKKQFALKDTVFTLLFKLETKPSPNLQLNCSDWHPHATSALI